MVLFGVNDCTGSDDVVMVLFGVNDCSDVIDKEELKRVGNGWKSLRCRERYCTKRKVHTDLHCLGNMRNHQILYLGRTLHDTRSAYNGSDLKAPRVLKKKKIREYR